MDQIQTHPVNVLTIDGGGTTTKCVLYTNGQPIAKYIASSIHVQQTTINEAKKILLQIEQYFQKYNIQPANTVISIGMAGYGKNIQFRQAIEELFSIFQPYPIYLFSDAHIALYGVFGHQDGILVIAGTGSIAFKKQQGIISRVGGWGYRLGDEGSSYAIGQSALHVFTKMADGRLKKTKLFDLLMEHFQLHDPYQIIPMTLSRTDIAQLAKIVCTSATNNDKVCLEILDQAMTEIAQHIITLSKEEPMNVRFVGGLWNSRSLLEPILEKKLPPHIICQFQEVDPNQGAYLLAIDQKCRKEIEENL